MTKHIHFMGINIQSWKLAVFLIALVLGPIRFVKAQEAVTKTVDDGFDVRLSSFLLPQPLPTGKYSHAIGLNYVIVPKDWALDNIQAPMFTYTGKYTLPYGFNIQGGLATLFISNRFLLGPFWNYSVNNYHFGVGYQIVYDYGVLNQFGFKTKLTGWEQQPSLTAGYSFKKSAIILRADLYYTNVLHLNEGGNTITTSGGFVNGNSLTATLEQRLWGNRLFSFGVKVNHIKYHIVAWPAFPVNQYRYYVPEFLFGLKF